MQMTLLLFGAWRDSGGGGIFWWRLVHCINTSRTKGSKTSVLVKLHHAEAAKEVYKGTGMFISTKGVHCLGIAIGASTFMDQYVTFKKSGILGG